ncbi:hypothetical protein EDB81DRAFT_265450 [Dactylonectria macrodidyma]|uniref:Uncharacterized protein n=1 Tax=Dactylonectria macrodidyma TaxID=307937 RepID=A0A9P9JJV0_9HYPO|nr:hypothetical protein EDB81DRAFT_265450 [Dactylonectria macrodidyma]
MDSAQAFHYKNTLLRCPSQPLQKAVFLLWWFPGPVEQGWYLKYINGGRENFIAICFHDDQVKLFCASDLRSIRIDLNSNFPSEWNMVEVVWSCYNQITQRALPLIQVFLAKETVEMFTFMYAKVFQTLRSEHDINVQWKHLHQTGLVGITIDQDYKNLMGFGHYLSSFVDQQHRDWTWQVKRCVRFCSVQFQQRA